jgi:hypothetical protein
LKFKKILSWLMTEVIYGRAHFAIVDGLLRADRRVLNAAPMFFEMTLGAHADAAQLTAARIFDRDGDVSIHTLLSSALREAGTFKHGTAAQVRKLVEETGITVATLEPVLTAVRTRRHHTLAHAGAIPLTDPDRYVKEGRMTFRDFIGLFDQTATILNDFSMLYRGVKIQLHTEKAKDYKQALDLISSATRDERQKP